jgi:tripartite-type tricarboxylate transporter receptor subunit TctC
MKERIKTLGFDMIASTPEEFGTQMKQDVARWGAVVEKAGMQRN